MTKYHSSNRRNFIKTAALLTGAALIPNSNRLFAMNSRMTREFTLCLNPGAIGVKANQKELLEMAIEFGYESIISMPDDLMKFSEKKLAKFLKRMRKKQISWGSTNLPTKFRDDDSIFKDDIKNLPAYAKTLQKVGATRMNTWINNGHNQLTYSANFKRHSSHLRECAKILEDHEIRLGLEYVGPKTSMTRRKYPFMRTMAETLELIAEIGQQNVGLVMDSFHWYCAGDTVDDILNLNKKDIITCDLNDARSDLSQNDQIDGTRELPGATGVIDLEVFLNALIEIGYDGPVRSEPFNQKLRDMEDKKALEVNKIAMKKSFSLVE